MNTDILRRVPRTTVAGYLRVARLPLNAAERIAKQQGNQSWPPALAFETVEARVESIVGSLVPDPALTESGRLRQARVAKLREADELKTVAALEKKQARQAEADRKAEIAEQRKQTVQAAEQRKQTAVSDAASQERKVEAKAAKKASAAQRQKAAQDKVIERRERAGRAGALDAEAKALELAKDALEADEKTDLIEATIEGNKEDRKTG